MLDQSKLQVIRTSLRKNSRAIIKTIIQNHIQQHAKNPVIIITTCMFCGSTLNGTKEHVLPRRVFDKSIEGFFTTDINGINQTYNKTTIPACLKCNSAILNSIEKYIQKLFYVRDVKDSPFLNEEIENIIRWLEIIDYKFLILNVVRKFKVSKQNGYIPYLADFPLSVFMKLQWKLLKHFTKICRIF